LVENSEDGKHYKQMRIFHMHETIERANIGVYACSPLDSSITAVFSELSLGACLWEPYAETEG
jgi:regulation of enolase protein 1 (concanavalin A-like superfamily)